MKDAVVELFVRDDTALWRSKRLTNDVFSFPCCPFYDTHSRCMTQH